MVDSYTATWRPSFRSASVLSADATYVELEKIRKKNDGELVPQHVVNAAASKHHKMHKMFEWDNTKAANKHRLEQARLVIRSIIIERPELPGVSVRQYETIRSSQVPTTKVYTTIEEIITDPESRTLLLQRALIDLLAMRRRYAALNELANVFNAIDEVLERV